MKFSYRDKMILIGLATAVIVLLGVFLGIKPTIKNIKDDKAELKKVEEEWTEKKAKIDKIPGLQEDINTTYEASKKLSEEFISRDVFGAEYTNDGSTFKVDKFLQEHLDECNIEVRTLDIGAPNIAEIGYYYNTPSVLTSSMLDAADVNGNYSEQIDDIKAESNSLSQRSREPVIRTQYGVSAKATKEDIWKFMDKIKSLDTTILIDTVTIADFTFGEDLEQVDPEDRDKSDVSFVISAYSVFPMDKPVVE